MPSNLYKRGQVYWGRAKVDGTLHRRSLCTTDEAEAQRRLKLWLKEIKKTNDIGRRMSWPDAVVRYFEEVAPEAIKPSTGKRYLVSLRQVGPKIEHLYVDQIGRRTIADLVSARRREGAGNATINRDLTAVSAVLAACVEWETCEANAAHAYSRRLTRERRDPIRPPTPAEVERLLSVRPTSFGHMVRFLHLTGCRQEEAASLTWEQVEIDEATITFLHTKASRPRTIRLNAETVGLLRRLRGSTEGSTAGVPVFGPGPGRRFANAASRFRELTKRAGVRFRCHDLRHGYAIRELKGGRDIYDLSRHLGHASVKTTEIYLGHVAGGGHKGEHTVTVSRGSAGQADSLSP